jgi:hypothetical protein
MTTTARTALQRKLARLEVKTVYLERFHIELHSAPPSPRIARQILMNRKAAANLAREIEAARAKLGVTPAPAATTATSNGQRPKLAHDPNQG